MNRHDGLHDLDDPSDEEVEVLHEICKVASTSTKPPFAALFASYETFFRERGLDTAHDPSVFRWLMRVAERVRPGRRNGQPLPFVASLKSLLRDRGILIVDQDQHPDNEDASKSLELSAAGTLKTRAPVRRRVSFDDAGLEETWLSEHSKSLNPASRSVSHHWLGQLPYRSKTPAASVQIPRARSISDHHRGLVRQSTLGRRGQHTEAPSVTAPEPEEFANPTLLFEPSQTQLEQNAEAFLATSEIRLARQCLHVWHDRMLVGAARRAEAYDIAAVHDRRTLLKQSLDILTFALRQQQDQHEHEAHLQQALDNYSRKKDRWLLAKAFSHWGESALHQKRVTAVAQRHIMKIKYFNRWRRIAVGNAMKARSVLLRKYVSRWRTRAAQRKLSDEQALGHYKETLVKNCFQHWFWSFCSRQVEGWHDQQVARRALTSWRARLTLNDTQDRQASILRNRNILRHGLEKLLSGFRRQREIEVQALQHYNRTASARCLHLISVNAQLTPAVRTISGNVDLSLKLKAIKVWRLHLSLNQQAATVDRKRILQSAWTSWNDALRCKALAQRIDERVLVESLYKWVLHERLRSFQKVMDSRSLQKHFGVWKRNCNHQRSNLNQALAQFRERERRRVLGYGMLRLYGTLRIREDANRAAVEFANARTVPKSLEVWKQKTEHVQRLEQWADDARFYSVSTRTLTLWREKTSEQKHNRRREAYAQVRSKIKFRMVKELFSQWRQRTLAVRTLQEEANRLWQARLIRAGVHGFDTWREKAARGLQMEQQASQMDRQKLLTSALDSVKGWQGRLSAMEEDVLTFRQESDLGLALAALKRIQWATFNASLRIESAYALLARSRDQHIRQMLRHMAAEVAKRRTAKAPTSQAEPESPSLRPASRIAARTELQSAPGDATPNPSTAAYMRTPVRSRRIGRFRPLDTPSMVTPMAFDPAFYVTTPAPLSIAVPADNNTQTQSGTYEGLTPQITPFARKLKAGGFMPRVPPSALRSSVFASTGGEGRAAGGTNKSVRFARSGRFSGGRPRGE